MLQMYLKNDVFPPVTRSWAGSRLMSAMAPSSSSQRTIMSRSSLSEWSARHNSFIFLKCSTMSSFFRVDKELASVSVIFHSINEKVARLFSPKGVSLMGYDWLKKCLFFSEMYSLRGLITSWSTSKFNYWPVAINLCTKKWPYFFRGVSL